MYNCTVRENRITALGLSLSGTIAIKQCACNRFLLTIESAMWQRQKKIRQVRGLSQLFNNVLDNAHTTRPWVTPHSGARGLASDSETLCLGVRYRTQRMPCTRPRDTEYYLFILFIFCVKLQYSRCSPPNIIPNRPAKKHMHNSLNTKIPFFMAFFSYVKTYHNGLGRPPRHGFIKSTFSIAENRVFDCHNGSIVECNYSVIDRQYETV